MNNSKMADMLKKFSTKELNRFAEYLSSPFFNKDDSLVIFFNHIKKHAPTFDTKETLLKKGIKGIVITEKKIGYMMSDIVYHAQIFLKYTKLNEQTIEGYCQLLSVYNTWENDKLFDQTMRETQHALKQFPYRNASFFYKEFLVENELNMYFDRQKKRSYDVSLQKATDHLDLFFLATKLKYSCELINRQKLVAANYQLPLLKEITNHLQEKKYDEYPAISIYYQILMTFLDNDSEAHFNTLKQLLEMHAFKFPADEARDMYAYAQNYCIRKINAGNQHFLREILGLYKAGLEKNILLVDGFLSPWTYKNIVISGLRAGEFDWTEQFIKKYKNQLNPKFRNNAYLYNQAYLLFFKNEFGEALKLLNQVEFTDIFYALDGRSMQIKIYYELKEITALQSAIEACKIYLRRNKTISENFKTIYMNLIKFINKLSNIREKDFIKLDKLKEQIEKTKDVADIKWLLQKVEGKRK